MQSPDSYRPLSSSPSLSRSPSRPGSRQATKKGDYRALSSLTQHHLLLKLWCLKVSRINFLVFSFHCAEHAVGPSFGMTYKSSTTAGYVLSTVVLLTVCYAVNVFFMWHWWYKTLPQCKSHTCSVDRLSGCKSHTCSADRLPQGKSATCDADRLSRCKSHTCSADRFVENTSEFDDVVSDKRETKPVSNQVLIKWDDHLLGAPVFQRCTAEWWELTVSCILLTAGLPSRICLNLNNKQEKSGAEHGHLILGQHI